MDIFKIVSEYGVLLAIAAVFIWERIKFFPRLDNNIRLLQEHAARQTEILGSLVKTTADNLAETSRAHTPGRAELKFVERRD
jgi:hypothetical protein